jgi:hypothetical protein
LARKCIIGLSIRCAIGWRETVFDIRDGKKPEKVVERPYLLAVRW